MVISGCQKLSRTSRSCGEQQSRAAKDAAQERVFKSIVPQNYVDNAVILRGVYLLSEVVQCSSLLKIPFT